ncbi:MAG TPA: LamG domain-containing protein, partial [Mucilaginibacter sp.]|nr:LamG domain-containing protein [Mucilaginibacter sp.]
SHSLITQGGTMQFVMSKDVSNRWPADKDPISLSETKTPVDIQLLKYNLQKAKVEPNELLWLHFTVKNNGAPGTKNVKLYVDGKENVSKNYLVQQGATITDSISFRLYRLGKVCIGLDSKGGTTVEVIEPTQPIKYPFEISGLTLKPLIQQNQEQKLSYTIKNMTGKDQQFSIPVNMNDSLLYTDHIQLAPGESKIQEHRFIDHNTGLKMLRIDSLVAKYKVYNNNTASLLLDLSLFANSKDQLITDRSGFDNNAHIIRSKTELNQAGKRILLGDDCFAEVPNALNLDNMEQTITMMAWVYPQGQETGLVDMLTKGDTHVLQMINNKTLTFFAGGWGRGDCTVNLPADWKQHWHHIAGVCNGKTMFVYIDGKLSGTSAVEGTVNLSTANKWQIGRNEEFPSERVFHGYMDNIKVYAQPLSAAEITAIFNKEKVSFENHPEN